MVIIVVVVLCTCHYSSPFCIALGIVVAVIPSEDIDGMQCSVKEIHANSPIPACQTGRPLFFVGNLHDAQLCF